MINILKILSPRHLANILMIGLDGQSLSGYGFTVTLHFPKEKRQEFLDEVFGGKE